MKRILVLGAGYSAPYLIGYLLKEAQKYQWFITVGDQELDRAQKIVEGHPCGAAIVFDINDSALRKAQFEKADIVVNFLPPVFQHLIALECMNYGTAMVSASYEDKRVRALNPDALRQGILILNEMGLDPGIDHMLAVSMIAEARQAGGTVLSFLSYGSGLPAPEVQSNPLRYCITWNPRNIVRSGEAGALYMEAEKVKVISHQNVFNRTWPVEVEDVGVLEAYPNRNSLIYKDLFGIQNVHTMIRGTLRYPGWSETWHQIVRLGLPNDTMPIPNVSEMSYRQFLRMFLPLHISGTDIERQTANYLHLNPTGKIMENLKWLGLFSRDTIGGNAVTAADVMINLLTRKLALPSNARDMVILVHEMEVQYPGEKHRLEKRTTTFVEYGEPGGFTAISKTVGLPAAIAVKLILNNALPVTGCHLPTHPSIYVPVLEELKKIGFSFKENICPLEK